MIKFTQGERIRRPNKISRTKHGMTSLGFVQRSTWVDITIYMDVHLNPDPDNKNESQVEAARLVWKCPVKMSIKKLLSFSHVRDLGQRDDNFENAGNFEISW